MFLHSFNSSSVHHFSAANISHVQKIRDNELMKMLISVDWTMDQAMIVHLSRLDSIGNFKVERKVLKLRSSNLTPQIRTGATAVFKAHLNHFDHRVDRSVWASVMCLKNSSGITIILMFECSIFLAFYESLIQS